MKYQTISLQYIFFVDFLDYSDKGMIYVTIEIVTISCVKMMLFSMQWQGWVWRPNHSYCNANTTDMAFKYNHIFQYTYLILASSLEFKHEKDRVSFKNNLPSCVTYLLGYKARRGVLKPAMCCKWHSSVLIHTPSCSNRKRRNRMVF